MRDKKNKKQQQIAAWLDKLSGYASENKLPMRIMDELDDCKKQIASPDIDWDSFNRTMEGLLNSMEQKTVPQAISGEKENHEISAQMVQEEIKKMAQRCRLDNTASINSMSERKNMIIKKNHEQLSEISYAKAHIEELKNEDIYLQFFQTCKTKYERDSFEMFRELLQSISGNYSYMMEQMKIMFQHINGYKNNIGNEKIYYEYDVQKDGIDQNVLGEVQSADVGGNDIMSFAQTTKKSVNKIVKKLTRKRKLLAWLPVLIILGILSAGVAGNIIVKQHNTEQIEKDADNENTFWEEKVQEALDGVNLMEITISFVLAVIVIVLIYTAYLKMLKVWCDSRICKQCSAYLKTELYQFEQAGCLREKLETAMENAAEEYERQYMNMLHHLFQDTQYDADSVQTGMETEFIVLRTEWNEYRNI